jgi:hypothetical protein
VHLAAMAAHQPGRFDGVGDRFIQAAVLDLSDHCL